MRETREPGPGDALLPLGFLALALFGALSLFGEDSSYGPNQIALMLAGCVALLVGLRQGRRWRELEREVFESMGIVFGPAFILLAVGVMIATWIAGGIVPTLIWYGLQVLDPAIFYAASCLACALVSLAIGSSWTTAASIGVALMGTAAGMGMSPAITAGAVISGAYFGDKMSPLSDTTNLAPAVAEVELFDHIRHMAWTGIPALAAALLLFLALGIGSAGAGDATELAATLRDLEAAFVLHPLLLLPLVVLLALAWRRMPAFPAILVAALLGGACAVLFQPETLRNLASGGESPLALLEGLWILAFAGFEAETGNEALDALLGGGGAANMLNTIWLILAAVFFGGAMERTGLLAVLVRGGLARVKSAAGLIGATLLTCIGANIIAGDQYIAIVLPGRMYKAAFHARNLAPVNLSRALEDSATVTSPLVPWNTCGAFMAATLGVATLAYLPWCFFNLLMPAISFCYGLINFRILPLREGDLALSTLPNN